MSKASGYVFIDDAGRWVGRIKTPDGRDTRKVLGYASERPNAERRGYGRLLDKRKATEWLDNTLAPWIGWTDDTDPTFSQAAEEYLVSLRAKLRRETTIIEYARIIRYELGYLAPFRLSRISEASIKRLQSNLAHRSCTNQVKTVLAGIVRIARKNHKYTGPDFSEWFERVPVKRKLEIEVYTPAEIERICKACVKPELAVIIRVAAYTGLRKSELRALTWGDVDIVGEKITVRHRYTDKDGMQPPKNGKIRTVPMARQVIEQLTNHVQTGNSLRRPCDFDSRVVVFGLVFGFGFVTGPPNNEAISGFPLSDDWLYKGYDRAIEQAGIRRLHFHCLRHVFGSTMVQRFPLTTVAEWLGHADLKTTQRYLHHVPRADDAQKMSDLLGGTDV